MRAEFNVIRYVFGAALSLAAMSGAAQAAGWHYYDPDCPITLNGGKTMKFVAMQPKQHIDRECLALPGVSPSVIVLDAGDNELREMNWDIRLLRGAPEKASDPEADLVTKLPTQKYRNGMVNFDQEFPGAGNYVLYVKLTSDDGKKSYVGQHPFSVGMMTDEELYMYIGFAIFIVAAGGLAFTLWRQGKLGFKMPDFSKTD